MTLVQSLTVGLVLPLISTIAPVRQSQKTVQAVLVQPADRHPAPAFQLRDASRKMRALSDFHGKPVVLNLWATACGGCRAELPAFVELHRTYKDQGLRVIGVSMDVMYEDLKSTAEAWARVTPFARLHGLIYDVLVDDGSVEKAYKVMAMPATYLIDKRGRIAATYVGVVDPADVKAHVQALLAEPK